MSLRTTRAKLLQSTVVPVVSDDNAVIAVKGDNMPPADDAPLTAFAVHEAIESTLQAIITSENAIEYARQKLAHQFDQRHTLLMAAPGGTIPAHTLATSNDAFVAYLKALTDEFNAASSAKRKNLSPGEVTKYNTALYARVRRALELFAHIAWGRENGHTITWNEKRMRWDVAPSCFIPPGWIGAGDLVFLADGKTVRNTIELEAENKSAVYYISKPRQPMRSCSPSLSQFIYAMQQHVVAASNPTVDVAEGTPETAKRAARQTKATLETPPATEAEAPATETSEPGIDADMPQDVSARTHACLQFAAAITTAAKWLATDHMIGVTRADLGNATMNGMADIAVLLRRIEKAEADAAEADAKKKLAAKPANGKSKKAA